MGLSNRDRPPCRVLFPYTTLFRSVTLRQLSANGTGNDLLDWTYTGGACVTITPPLNGAKTVTCRRNFATPQHQGTDRKSTRLNSSHSQISYAVCCLKKQSGGTPPD